MMRRRGPSLLGVVAVSAATTHVMQKGAQNSANQQQAAQQQAYDQGAAAAQQQAYDAQQAAAAQAAEQKQMADMQAQMAAMQAQAAAAPAAVAAPDVTTQLTQLASLKDQGIITQDEFDAKKKQLLGI